MTARYSVFTAPDVQCMVLLSVYIQSAMKDLTSAQEEVRKLTISRDKAMENFSSAQKQLETKELVSAGSLLRRQCCIEMVTCLPCRIFPCFNGTLIL